MEGARGGGGGGLDHSLAGRDQNIPVGPGAQQGLGNGSGDSSAVRGWIVLGQTKMPELLLLWQGCYVGMLPPGFYSFS